jgi:hypothetical protein
MESNKTETESKTEQKIPTLFETLPEISQEEFFAYWKFFTPLEQDIIKTLYFSPTLSVKEIRRHIIQLMEYEIIRFYDPETARKYKPSPCFKLSILVFLQDKETIKKEIRKLSKIMEIKEEEYKKSVYKYQTLVEEFLKNTGNKPPSFGTIENALLNLKNLGIVVSRAVEKSKAKAYYILNPKFTILITKTKFYQNWMV